VTSDTGAGALQALRAEACDCVVLDLKLPDMSGFEVLEQIGKDDALCDVPVVVFTGRELSAEEDAELHTMARSIVVKGVESPNACSTRPRCSCTGSSPNCRRKNSACWNG
jgi:Response regulator containing CheY-like receiver, AAA-type ATPase, and DNA-binding domains